MSDMLEQIKALEQLGDIELFEEGEVKLLLIKQIKLPPGCEPAMADCLLWPAPRDGYPCRLFFAEQIKCPKSLNWNALGARIIERNWHAFSWKVNDSEPSLMQMVISHLSAMR